MSDDAIPDSFKGHTTGSTGLNGVGKLISTKSTSNTTYCDVGLTYASGSDNTVNEEFAKE